MAQKKNPSLSAMPRAKRDITASKADAMIRDLQVLNGTLRASDPTLKAARALTVLRNLEGKLRDMIKDIDSNTDWTSDL